jgi:hypothetical protein
VVFEPKPPLAERQCDPGSSFSDPASFHSDPGMLLSETGTPLSGNNPIVFRHRNVAFRPRIAVIRSRKTARRGCDIATRPRKAAFRPRITAIRRRKTAFRGGNTPPRGRPAVRRGEVFEPRRHPAAANPRGGNGQRRIAVPQHRLINQRGRAPCQALVTPHGAFALAPRALAAQNAGSDERWRPRALTWRPFILRPVWAPGQRKVSDEARDDVGDGGVAARGGSGDSGGERNGD